MNLQSSKSDVKKFRKLAIVLLCNGKEMGNLDDLRYQKFLEKTNQNPYKYFISETSP